MRNTYILLILCTLISNSCSSSLTSNSSSNVDSSFVNVNYEKSLCEFLNKAQGDSSYIGLIYNFYYNCKDESYIGLYSSKENNDLEDFNKLVETGDSTIYEDDENKRIRIPIEIAKKNFILTGLEPLYIYDLNHKLVKIAHIKRIEYLDQAITSQFIAVFDSKGLSKNESYYCVGNKQLNNNIIQYRLYLDSYLTSKIVTHIKIDETKPYECKHYKTKSDSTTFSILNSDTLAYIIESSPNNISVLFKSSYNENIGKTIFLPTLVNKKPVILVECYLPDSDVFWETVFIYDGNRYVNSDHQRIFIH